MCSLSFLSIAPSLNFNIAYVGSAEFQMETYIIYPEGFHFLTTWLGDWWFRLMVLDGTAKKMDKVSKRMCWAIILPSRFFHFATSSLPLPSWFAKVSNINTRKGMYQNQNLDL